MQIANRIIPIAEGHTLSSILTNGVYNVLGVALAAVSGWAVAPVAVAFNVQGFASTLFHATPDKTHVWAQVLDGVSIQWVLALMLGLSVATLGVPLLLAYLATTPALVWWWHRAHTVRRNRWVIIQGALVLGVMAVACVWWQTLLALALIAAAVLNYFEFLVHHHHVWRDGESA